MRKAYILVLTLMTGSILGVGPSTIGLAQSQDKGGRPAAPAQDSRSKSDQKPAASDLGIGLPDTPAGKTVAEFFRAFNSGDSAIMRRFHEEHGASPENADQDMEFYKQSGGLKPHSVKSSDSEGIEVLVQTKSDGNWILLQFIIDKQAPYAIMGIRANPGSAPPK
ncbi:MAG TPA: hypothetical protein VF762_18035 [Blastocatellia bacterium]